MRLDPAAADTIQYVATTRKRGAFSSLRKADRPLPHFEPVSVKTQPVSNSEEPSKFDPFFINGLWRVSE
jgi:hypothetical protein